MCHAMTTRNRPCRRRGSAPLTLTTQEVHPETFKTGLCALHTAELDQTGIIDLWRPNEPYGLRRVPARRANERTAAIETIRKIGV
jgi:hypothetical protein